MRLWTDHKLLEHYRGYLIYICWTYPFIVPYLKGLHLTIDSWRANHDIDGWKLLSVELHAVLSYHQNGADHPPVSDQAPKFVTAVPQLMANIQALKQLFSSELPPKCPIRPSTTAVALYGFADASGSGFGSSLLIGNEVHSRHGQ